MKLSNLETKRPSSIEDLVFDFTPTEDSSSIDAIDLFFLGTLFLAIGASSIEEQFLEVAEESPFLFLDMFLMVDEVFFFFDEVFASIKALFLRLAEVEVETDFRSEVVVKELTE